MKKILLFFFFIVSIMSYSQKPVSRDDLEKRDGLYYEKNSDIPFTGFSIEVIGDGRFRGLIDWENGRIGGRVKEFYNNEGFLYWDKEKETGILKTYHENGQLAQLENYKYEQKEGLVSEGSAKQYAENGQLLFEGNYKNGLLDGIFKLYHENGQLYIEGNYKEGKTNGVFKLYDEEGWLMMEEINPKLDF